MNLIRLVLSVSYNCLFIFVVMIKNKTWLMLQIYYIHVGATYLHICSNLTFNLSWHICEQVYNLIEGFEYIHIWIHWHLYFIWSFHFIGTFIALAPLFHWHLFSFNPFISFNFLFLIFGRISTDGKSLIIKLGR